MPLPDDAPKFVKDCPAFQTYDLGKGMGSWTITEDGGLQCDQTLIGGLLEQEFSVKIPPCPISYKRKRIEMTASNLRGAGPRKGKYVYFTEDGSDLIEITYIVQIRNGKVSSIKEKLRTQRPARPMSEMR
jgi:hypothetical protein